MQALPLRAAVSSSAQLCLIVFASTAIFAQSGHAPAQAEKPLIELAPSPLPDPALYPPRPGDAPFKNAPANYHVFAPVHAGQTADAETLTLKFSASTQLTKIESTKDFVVDAGSRCQTGNRYSEGDTCNLLIRFTPQGAGHRLGKLTIAHTASPKPMSLGLVGNGYAPVISFTPALITTVPGTYPSNKGLLSGAQNLTVDGGDILYIADYGNDLIRQIDSSGTISNTTPVTAPTSISVDTFGYIWALPAPTSSGYQFYFAFYVPGYGPIDFFGPYSPGTCTESSPCILNEVGLGNAGSLSIDPYNNLFFEEESYGAAEIPVASIANGGSGFQDPNISYLRDSYAPVYPSTATPTAFSADAEDNLYTFYNNGTADCDIVEESLGTAETDYPVNNRVAGATTCGFSGDGGQARDAEISDSVGQIFFDIAGNLYFSDTNNQRVRRIDASTGQINTIAGDGTAGYSGDGVQAISAELSSPTGVAVDSQGQVYIISSASSGQVVRKLGPNGSLNFSTELRNVASAAHIVTVANTGNYDMTLTRAFITGTNAGDFAIDPNTTTCDLTAEALLFPGESCKVGVIFTPAAAGARSADLIFLDNTVTGTNTVQLAGSGILPTPTFKITAPASGATETSGTAFTFSVSVTSSGTQPTGTVKMLLNGTAISGSPATLNGSGAASLSVTSTTTSTNTLSATYNGDSNYAATGPITENITVNAPTVKKESKVTVTSSANPAATCKTITFSATVTGTGEEKPTGTVKLMKGTDLLGEATLSKGEVRLTGIKLAAGTSELTAHYGGDSTHEASTSAAFKQVVSDAGCSADAGTVKSGIDSAVAAR
jgi:hypothetical protein